jgi:putative transposase
MRPLEERRSLIESESRFSVYRQCEMLSIHRSGLYYKPTPESQENLDIMLHMDKQYLKTPFYGIRRMHNWLEKKGYVICRKRVKIERANQVWAIDITYIPMRKGFMYLCAVIDVHTRYVLNWSLSNTMTSQWCRTVVEEAIAQHGAPEIINSDQGSQFTSFEYTSLLIDRNEPIAISMDGKGRAIDNIFIERLWKSVKYECVYLHAFEDGVALYQGLSEYFTFYSHERDHQSLGYQTPASCYRKAA